MRMPFSRTFGRRILLLDSRSSSFQRNGSAFLKTMISPYSLGADLTLAFEPLLQSQKTRNSRPRARDELCRRSQLRESTPSEVTFNHVLKTILRLRRSSTVVTPEGLGHYLPGRYQSPGDVQGGAVSRLGWTTGKERATSSAISRQRTLQNSPASGDSCAYEYQGGAHGGSEEGGQPYPSIELGKALARLLMGERGKQGPGLGSRIRGCGTTEGYRKGCYHHFPRRMNVRSLSRYYESGLNMRERSRTGMISPGASPARIEMPYTKELAKWGYDDILGIPRAVGPHRQSLKKLSHSDRSCG